ncbi:MAG: heme ABC exporter ATP-binding protein CcmA [Ilumatobacteraceae bacterium]
MHDAVVVYGDFPALAGMTFSVRKGEILLLQGPNGAGKSTLLRTCAGLTPIFRGTAEVLGHDLRTERDLVRHRVGFLGHSNGLFSDLTIRENVMFWSRLVDAGDDETEAALERMGIGGRLADLRVGELSAGQKRRCSLANLVVRRAELWLLDEPHAGLDGGGRDELDAILRQAVASGATVILASHELERTRQLATRVVQVSGGQILDASL